MVQAIICDFDFTLADSSPGVVACVNEALAGLGLPPASAERIHATIGLSLPHTLQALTGVVDPALAMKFTRHFVAHADQVMHGLTLLYPWVAETVQALRAAGQLPAIDVLYVGDHPVDAEAASRVGVPFIAVLTGTSDVPSFAPYPVHSFLANVSHLPSQLQMFG
jgi:phosphoglycolate phosphatase